MPCSSGNDILVVEEGTEKNPPVEENMISVEDGRAWLTLAGVFLIQFGSFGYNISFGAYQGWIGGIQLFLIFTMGPLVGRLFDRGYFHHMMIVGTLLHSLSFFMLSLSHENEWYQVFLAHGVGSGFASGIVYIPSLAVVSHHFKRHRALALGIVAAGTATGATVHPIILNHLFHSHIGFHGGVRISAGINTACFVLANAMMRTSQSCDTVSKSKVPVTRLFWNPAYDLMVIAAILSNFAMFFPGFFIQLSAELQGINRATAFYYISILNGTSVVGRTFIPFLCSIVGVINLNVICAFGMAISIFCLSFVKSSTGYILFAVAFGFISGANVALVPPAIASLSETVEEIGARMGIAFALSGVAALFSTPISGALLTTDYHWERPIVFTGVCALSSAIFVLISRFFVAKAVGSYRI